MGLQKDRTRINAKGGGNLYARQLVSGSTDTAFVNLGQLVSSGLDDSPAMVDSVNEGGELVMTQVGSRKAKWDAVLMQAGIDEINLLRQADGKFYEIYYAVPLKNGNTQEVVACPVIIVPKVTLAFAAATQRNIPVEIIFLMPKAAYTRNPTDYNNSTPNYYVMIENAVAKGAPVDQVGTVYTAVV